MTAKADYPHAAKVKALTALISAVDVYKAFETLKAAGLVRDKCSDGLDDAICDAAIALLDADAAFAEALEEAAAAPEPKPVKAPSATLQDVKLAVVTAQKRGHVKAIQGIVMAHGGQTAGEGGTLVPSLTALPREKYAACIAAIEALPSP